MGRRVLEGGGGGTLSLFLGLGDCAPGLTAHFHLIPKRFD